MQSREYQDLQVAQVIDAIGRYRTVLCQLPTGGGKTVEFSLIIKAYLHKLVNIEPGPTLILVHRKELLHQAARAVKEILGFEPCLITSDTSRFWIARVYIGMVESTLSRLHMINHPSLIIVDECHMQNFNKVHRQFPDAKFLGFSATPISASKREPMKKYYETIIVGPQIRRLINDGYLAQNLTRAPKHSVDPRGFDYDRLIGDYNQRQVASAFSMTQNITNVIHKYWEFCKGKKTLVFNVNIEHSQEVNSAFVACGINARHLDSSSDKRPSKDPRCENEREEIFLWFKETPNAVLNSVMIPTMGFDEPTVESIMLNFSTLSLVKFIQCCGRGSRIIDEYFIHKKHSEYPYELKLKTHFDIIDLGQNWKNFGDWNDERDWRYIFYYPDEPGSGIAPVKSCPSCEALVHAAVRVCPYCGHEFEKRRYQQMDMEEMILITKGVNIDELMAKGDKKYKYYTFLEMAIDIVQNMFLTHGKDVSRMMVERHFRAYFNMCVEWHKKKFANNEDEIDDISESLWHMRKAANNFNSLILKKNKNAPTINLDTVRSVINPEYSQNQKLQEENWKRLNENLTI